MKILIVATVGSIVLAGAPVRTQVVTREISLPPLGESPAPALHETPAAVVEPVDDFTEVREQYRTAAASHDIETMKGLFAEDGVLVASDQDVLRGREEIANYLADAIGLSMPELTLTCVTAENRNGYGSESGRFEERVTSFEGAITRVSGVYLTIYRRDDAGRWRVAIEIRSRGGQQALGIW